MCAQRTKKKKRVPHELPSKPDLEYLRKQAESLHRSVPGRKLAETQHPLADGYGFAFWARLKWFALQHKLPPTEALKVAVCNSDARAVADVLSRYPELKATIDEPLPGYAFGQHALFAAVQRSGRATIAILLRFGAHVKSALNGGPANSVYLTTATHPLLIP